MITILARGAVIALGLLLVMPAAAQVTDAQRAVLKRAAEARAKKAGPGAGAGEADTPTPGPTTPRGAAQREHPPGHGPPRAAGDDEPDDREQRRAGAVVGAVKALKVAGHARGLAGEDRRPPEQVRAERHQALHKKLRTRVVPQVLSVELRTHARRIAQIARLRELVPADDQGVLDRIAAMEARENERHERRMARLVSDVNATAPQQASADKAGTADESDDVDETADEAADNTDEGEQP